MKYKYILLSLIVGMLNLNSSTPLIETTMEEAKIRKMVERCYLNGALNIMNTNALFEGYHPDFAIFFADGRQLKKLPLTDWAEIVEQYKNSGDSSGLRNFEYEFLEIDVSGTAAFVKLKLIRDGELVFTDLITLLKFEGDWKIVTKIYHAHVENPWKL